MTNELTAIEFKDSVTLLAQCGGLLHDIGKLTRHFQAKLTAQQYIKDVISHEWISAWIIKHMLELGEGISWTSFVQAWQAWETGVQAFGATLNGLESDRWHPIDDIASPASALLMIVATHHRPFSADKNLPTQKMDPHKVAGMISPSPTQNHLRPEMLSVPLVNEDWHHCNGLLDKNIPGEDWSDLLKEANDNYRKLEKGPSNSPEYWHKAGLVARAALILADHQISAQEFKAGSGPFANTRHGKLNQPLSWHLTEVGKRAAEIAPHLVAATDLPALPNTVRNNFFAMQADPSKQRFKWQHTGSSGLKKIAQKSCNDGYAPQFLIFNTAGTGSGKTRGNMKFLAACRDENEPLRITTGLNLRSLTLQTADSYRNELNLKMDQCACLIGDALTRDLYFNEKQSDPCDADAVLEHYYSSVGCDSPDFLGDLPKWLKNLSPQHKNTPQILIAAPVLVATMDFLVAAGEPNRQADHAHALFRLAHSDLIIDEVDSYDPHSLVAILRLVQLAAMFGRNVVVSSATLSPLIAQYIHLAWRSGTQINKESGSHTVICHTILISDCGKVVSLDETGDSPNWFDRFGEQYRDTMNNIYAEKKQKLRLGQIVDYEPTSLTKTLLTVIETAHVNHCWEMKKSNGNGIKVSIGVVRMANVDPLIKHVELMKSALQKHSGIQIRVCAYHGREVMMRRYIKEQALDSLLKRHGVQGETAPGAHEAIKGIIDQLDDQIEDIAFVVFASPVEEIGRDHDFDWGIIEPSSLHSIIQLAGRINRHRLVDVTNPNIFILNKNIKAARGEKPSFTMPGFQFTDEATGKIQTHLKPSMTYLLTSTKIDSKKMRPLDKGFPIDASLIFSENHRCRFADEDDKGIESTLGKVVAHFSSDNKYWACDWLYLRYPLRDSNQNATWRALVNEHSNGYKLELFEPNNNRHWTDKSCNKHEYECDDMCWLSPSLLDATKKMRAILEVTYHDAPERIDAALKETSQFGTGKDKTTEDIQITWAGVKS
ncbi:HD domain-containing protein [Pseudaeromonas sp. ZJS20]|uniref:hypothetical protein n=1 Tax=Pseudaeromonas aegiceratis TaxID=3153928 RepID=UPI00390C5BA5